MNGLLGGTVELSSIYIGLARLHYRDATEARGFSGPLAMRAAYEGFPPLAAESLLDAIKEAGPGIFRDYLRKKAPLLRVSPIVYHDILAELPGAPAARFQDALDEIVAVWGEFSPELGAVLARVAGERRLLVRPRGFTHAADTTRLDGPGAVPWVAARWDGLPKDEFDLARTMGGALHLFLAGRLGSMARIPSRSMGLVSGCFGEALLGEWTQAPGDGEGIRRASLCMWLDSIYYTVFRCGLAAAFEDDAHRMAHGGAKGNDLAARWHETVTGALGDAAEIPPKCRWAWMTFPELFEDPFTLYRFPLAQLIALDLLRRLREGEAMAPTVTAMLAAGSSAPTMEILEAAGVGPLDGAFWRRCLGEVRRLVDSL
jgi:oligoendopeptidase F